MVLTAGTPADTFQKEDNAADELEGDTRQSQEDDEEEQRLNKPKRRRITKVPDKKYECPHEGCGKSYSRAEHLYRHQLNRTLVYETIRMPD